MAGAKHSHPGIDEVLNNNATWADSMEKSKPDFFSSLANQQLPQYLWIGCSDSRVPANQILGLNPGEVFVQRNVGNLATHKDMNCMSCLEYAVDVLKVKHVIVCGHYNCGAVRASLALPTKTPGLVNLWIADIRDTRNRYQKKLQKLNSEAQIDRMCELNVVRQVFNVCTSPVVQTAWARGQELTVNGLIYSVANGRLKKLTESITTLEDFSKYSRAMEQQQQQESMGAPIDDDTLMTDLMANFGTHMGFEQPAATKPAQGVDIKASSRTSIEETRNIDDALQQYGSTGIKA